MRQRKLLLKIILSYLIFQSCNQGTTYKLPLVIEYPKKPLSTYRIKFDTLGNCAPLKDFDGNRVLFLSTKKLCVEMSVKKLPEFIPGHVDNEDSLFFIYNYSLVKRRIIDADVRSVYILDSMESSVTIYYWDSITDIDDIIIQLDGSLDSSQK